MKHLFTRSLLAFASVLLVIINHAQAQTWVPAGPSDTTQPMLVPNYANAFVSDKAGGFYIGYQEPVWNASQTAALYKASVRRWTGSTWQQVGATGFSSGSVSSITLAKGNGASAPPYVAYKDNGNGGKAVVKFFVGTAWTDVGGGIVSPGAVNDVAIAIDASGTPYVAYSDSTASGKVTVKSFNGTSWQVVGTPAFTPAYTFNSYYIMRVALNSAGVPHVLVYYLSAAGTACEVFRLNGSTWASLGAPNSTPVAMTGVDFTISKKDTVYAAFTDDAVYTGASVSKYTGTAWATVGNPNVFYSKAVKPCLRTDTSGMPYLACSAIDSTLPYWSPGVPAVRRYNGSTWVTAGPDSFVVRHTGSYCLLDFTPANKLHILYMDDPYGKSLLRRLDPAGWTLLGSSDGFGDAAALATYSGVTDDGNTVYSGTQMYPLLRAKAAVYRYNSGSWGRIGQSGTSGWSGSVQALAVHPDGNPWIAVEDSVTGYATVWRYDGSAWISTGNVDTPYNNITLGLTIDGAGVAYFGCIRSGGGITVRQYSGGAWATLTTAAAANSVDFFRLVCDRNNALHVIYSSGNYFFAAAKFTGPAPGTWTSVGPTFSAANSIYQQRPDLAFDTANVPHVAFVNTSAGELRVKKLTALNTWTDAAPAIAAQGSIPRLQMPPNGALFLTYIDRNSNFNGAATVQRLVSNAWQVVGTASFSKSATYVPEMLPIANSLLTTFTFGAPYAYKADCPLPAVISVYTSSTISCTSSGATTISISASNATGYRWQLNAGDGWKNVPVGSPYSGVTSGNLSIGSLTTSMSGYRYRCVLSNPCGGILLSNPALLQVDTPGRPAPVVSIATDKAAACAGMPVRFTATVTNSGFLRNYQWRINGVPVTGATDSFFITSIAPGDVVTCVFTRTSVCLGAPSLTATGTAPTVIILPVTPATVAVSASPGTTVGYGASVVFTGTVTSGGLAPQYQWLLNGNDIPGATGNTFASNTLQDGDLITLRVTRIDTCASNHVTTSAPLTVHITSSIRGAQQWALQAYPQPASESVTLRGDLPAGIYSLMLFNSAGQRMMEASVIATGDAWTHTVALPASLPAGIYRLELRGSDAVVQLPIVVSAR